MNLFLVWLLQHYIIAIFTAGLKDNLAHGVSNPVHGKARLLFSKHANVQHGDERNLTAVSNECCHKYHNCAKEGRYVSIYQSGEGMSQETE